MTRVPFLKPEEIDNAARNLIHRFSTTCEKITEPPIPVEDICEKFLRLDIVPGDLEKEYPEKPLNGAIGALDLEEETVYVDMPKNPVTGRYRFTLAHEVGHFELHRNFLKHDATQCELFSTGKARSSIVCRAEDRIKPIEWQANKFAAALLMPRRMIIYRIRHFKELYGLQSLIDVPVTELLSGDELVSYVSVWFEVSTTAARIRLEDLHIITRVNQAAA
jgi:Zn-dependent peptidase ImmA (M78 family)